MREYSTFASFATHLEKLAVMGPAVTEGIAAAAGAKIMHDAKAKIGNYQPAAGPFNAWAQLAQATMSDRVRQGYAPNDPLLRSGQLSAAIEMKPSIDGAVVGVPHGQHTDQEGRTVDMGDLATWMETGTKNSPPRPFLGPAAFESKHAVSLIAGRSLIAWLMGKNFLKPPQSIMLP